MNKNNKFTKFINENRNAIEMELHTAGCAFVSQVSEITTNELILDDRWHYLDNDKEQKKSYIGEIRTFNSGVPYLHLTYNDYRECPQYFKEGRFDVVNAMWEAHKTGNTPAKITKFQNSPLILNGWRAAGRRRNGGHKKLMLTKPLPANKPLNTLIACLSYRRVNQPIYSALNAILAIIYLDMMLNMTV